MKDQPKERDKFALLTGKEPKRSICPVWKIVKERALPNAQSVLDIVSWWGSNPLVSIMLWLDFLYARYRPIHFNILKIQPRLEEG